MFNNIKRNLKMINKDVVETSWLKCLLDDIPKQKHLFILYKCLNGQQSKVAKQKIAFRIQHPQKPLTALKTLYLIHELNIRELLVNDIVLPSDSLYEIAHLYQRYLQCQQIDILFKMHRQLELLIFKFPIIQQITTKLIGEVKYLYEQLPNDLTIRVKGAKQLKRFLEIRNHLTLSQELQTQINSLKFPELQQQSENTTVVNNFFPTKRIPSPYRGLRLTLSKIQDISNTTVEEMPIEKQNQSLHSSPTRKRYLNTTTTRAVSIRDNFFVPQQGPLSFMIMQ